MKLNLQNGEKQMKKGLLKTIAGIMATALLTSGCSLREKSDVTYEKDAATEATTEDVYEESAKERVSTASAQESVSTTSAQENEDTVKEEPEGLTKDYADEKASSPEVGKELYFHGYYSNQGPESSDYFSVVDSNPEYDLDYDYLVSVDLTKKQKDYVLANPYDEFEITFVYTEEMQDREIYNVKAENIEIVKEDPSAGANYDASTDPLAGLVAEDILTGFRTTNAVKDTGSINSEATALGHWVQKTIGKDGFSEEMKENGKHIGYGYEFCFGTDISNNFDNNLPTMYGIYYALKDYYTSDGARSKDYYDRLMENNNYLGTGNPETIKQLYQDLQEFISTCNNLIRERL